MGLFSSKKDDDKKKEEKKATPTVNPTTGIVEGDASAPATPTVTIPKTDDATVFAVLEGPHVTEKASMLQADNQYVFRVAKNANKIQVKKAIETLYKVTVDGVRVVNIHPKKRRLGRTLGVKSGYKKAIVRLKDGDRIDVTA